MVLVLMICVAGSLSTATVSGRAPPYSGTASYLFGSATASSCRSDSNHLTGPVAWHPSTGRLSVAESSRAGTCRSLLTAGSGASSSARSEAGWYLLVPVHVRNTTSNETVRAAWNISWSSIESYTMFNLCRGTLAAGASYGYLQCSVAASVSFYLLGYLYDATTGTFYFSSVIFPSVFNFSFESRSTVCAPACHTTRGSAPAVNGSVGSLRNTFRFDLVHPNATHLWELYFVGLVSTFASVSTIYENFTGVVPLNATARSSLDLATGGRGAWLTAVTAR